MNTDTKDIQRDTSVIKIPISYTQSILFKSINDGGDELAIPYVYESNVKIHLAAQDPNFRSTCSALSSIVENWEEVNLRSDPTKDMLGTITILVSGWRPANSMELKLWDAYHDKMRAEESFLEIASTVRGNYV